MMMLMFMMIIGNEFATLEIKEIIIIIRFA